VSFPAALIEVLIMAQGVLGLVSPTMLAGVVGTIQIPPVIYFAAVFRVLSGIVLVLAASGSRAPNSLRGLGALIFLAGLLTPFFGLRFAQRVLACWSDGGPQVVRAWAGALLLVGGFIVYANIPSRRAGLGDR
jgi:predicted tellurium resistance membrane protein TerC